MASWRFKSQVALTDYPLFAIGSRVLHTGRGCPESMCLLSGSWPVQLGLTTDVGGLPRPSPQMPCGVTCAWASCGISWRTMAQSKPVSSQAMATHTSLVSLPARVSVR